MAGNSLQVLDKGTETWLNVWMGRKRGSVFALIQRVWSYWRLSLQSIGMSGKDTQMRRCKVWLFCIPSVFWKRYSCLCLLESSKSELKICMHQFGPFENGENRDMLLRCRSVLLMVPFLGPLACMLPLPKFCQVYAVGIKSPSFSSPLKWLRRAHIPCAKIATLFFHW
jgi:hypothetical protein